MEVVDIGGGGGMDICSLTIGQRHEVSLMYI